jgi:acid phosphatase
MVIGTNSFLLVSICLIIRIDSFDFYPSEIISGGPTYLSYKFNVLEHLTGISPYFQSNENELSPDPSQGCQIGKAAYLIRHGSVYVDDYDYYHIIQPFLNRLKNLSNSVNFSKSIDLSFLSNWNSPIENSNEQIEKLTKSGILEAFKLGTQLSYRYPQLLPREKNASFKVWTSSSSRTKESASTLVAGLFGRNERMGKVISIPEDKKVGANSLTPTKSCPRFKSSTGAKESNIWLKHYTHPIIQRLNKNIFPFHFIPNDILAMQELCGYETVIRGSSPFCQIFNPQEWISFEYYFDIKYYYELGYGNHLSPIIGMPWLVASSNLFKDSYKTDQNLYISVAHREMLPIILTSLGLYNDSAYINAENIKYALPLDQINYHRTWKSSKIIPFMGHVALERMDCNSDTHNGSFVRIIVNSIPKPLPGCSNGPGGSCPLSQYNNYINRRNGLYKNFSKACHVHSNSTNDSFTHFQKG